MRSLMIAALVLFASPADAADEMTIAVFTKNSTNPAYEAFRIASDRHPKLLRADRRRQSGGDPAKGNECQRRSASHLSPPHFTSGRGSGTKSLRLGILIAASVLASSVASAGTRPLRLRIYAETA